MDKIMIPKIIHYIWLGGKKSDLAKKCIDSYYKWFPDYSIKEWNESNIYPSDFSSVLKYFYNECYENKKLAFCSDIVRLYVLKKNGGIYCDTDVEFLKPIPNEMLDGTPFLCRDNPLNTIGCGCIWCVQPNDRIVSSSINWFEKQLRKSRDVYGKKWIFNDILRMYFKLKGYDVENKETQDIDGYRIYSTEYFCPMNFKTRELNVTDKTISIHHYAASWNLGLRNLWKKNKCEPDF